MKILLFIVSFFSSLFFGQIPGLINYNENNGLNCSYTYHLRQDKNGFIWIGSDNGLFRFDGNEFKQYGRKEGLKNIDIISCEPLPNGEVFLIPFQNDFAYLKNGRVISSDINNHLKHQFPNTIPLICNDRNKLYLYNWTNPKDIFIYENGKIKKKPIQIKYKSALTAIKFDCRSNILYLKDDPNNSILCYDLVNKNEKKIGTERGFFLCEKNNFFVFNEKGAITIYKLVSTNQLKKIRTFKIKEDVFYGSIDKNNKLWLHLVNGGLLYFNQSLINQHVDLVKPIKLMDDYIINNILVDKDDNLWFNSRNNGVFFITRALLENYINLPRRYIPENIKAIATDGKKILLGYNKSAGAIYSNGKIKNIILDQHNKTENRSVYVNNDILIFGFSDKIIIQDLSLNKNFRLGYGIKNIVPYNHYSIFLCTIHGLLHYNLKNKKIHTLTNDRTYTVQSYTKDSLFVGDFRDLYKLNAKTKKKKLFLEGYYFTDIKKLKENLYVGATNLNGIILFNSKGIISKITESNGLINDQVKKIEIQNQNIFWASTNFGITRIETRRNKILINNFTKTDGLPSNVVSGCVIKNDSIFIGTSNGLGIFSIQKLLGQARFINKKVIINSVIIGKKEHYNFEKELIGQNPNNVIINLSFPDYNSQGEISYKYTIEGLNNNWQTSNSSKIILNSIPAGKYIFKVFGVGYNGKQSFKSTNLSFEIKPQFWQTWWFKLFSGLFLSIIIITLIIWYLQKKRNKKLETLYYEKKIAELELQAIKAQINPHFIYNCLNSIQFLLYKKDYEETENYLNIFSTMIRQTLHYSEKTFMPIKQEIDYLSLYLDMEKLRLKNLFEYEISVSEKVNKNWMIPSLLIQPFVENAIKHGISSLKDKTGYIKIIFDFVNSSLCIIIEDNGIGITLNEVNKINSFGVKLSQKRIETFKQLFETNISLEINNLSKNTNKGTQIKIYITPYENQNTSMHH